MRSIALAIGTPDLRVIAIWLQITERFLLLIRFPPRSAFRMLSPRLSFTGFSSRMMGQVFRIRSAASNSSTPCTMPRIFCPSCVCAL